MPCDSIQTATVDIGKVDKELLAKAMEVLEIRGWTMQGNTLTVRGRSIDSEALAKVKQEYSRQVVLTQAKKFGWQIKETAPYKFQVIRR